MSDTIVKLIWTSGWGSTYRLLELVLAQSRSVQPCYVLGCKRFSSKLELQAMRKIKQAIFLKKQEANTLIKETVVIDALAASKYEDITQSFKRLKVGSFIGYQYDFLSRVASYYQ